jgi:hypothetical protein
LSPFIYRVLLRITAFSPLKMISHSFKVVFIFFNPVHIMAGKIYQLIVNLQEN